MKTIRAIYTIIVFAAATTVVAAQDYPEEYLGLPGDNLNLYAVMNLFQESETLEDFEKSLNSEELMINNLDLNGDNYIDYITVSDYVDQNVHNIVLRAALNANEQQDVAVFVVEQLSNGAVQIQLIGDEALYGPNYIVEPIYAETPNPGYTGKVYRTNVNVVTTSYYDIAAWPLIRFIFHPGYIVWRSSWYWGYYPVYWSPWRAHYWHYYYGYHYHWHDYYYTHYRHWDYFRGGYYNTYYRAKVRVYSPTVIVNINNNRYRNTYSRPDRRVAGEEYYARTASNRSNATVQRTQATRSNATVQRTQTTRSNATVQRDNNNNAVQRTQTTRSNAVQQTQANRSNTTVQRSNNSNAVQRTQTTRTTAVQKSQPTRTTAVQRSQPTRTTAVQRSQPARTSAVQRSQPASNRSAVQRSTSKKTAPAVQRSSSRSSSTSVKRSQPSSTRSSTVQRSQSSRKSSTVQRSSSSSSSQRSQVSARSGSSSRKR